MTFCAASTRPLASLLFPRMFRASFPGRLGSVGPSVLMRRCLNVVPKRVPVLPKPFASFGSWPGAAQPQPQHHQQQHQQQRTASSLSSRMRSSSRQQDPLDANLVLYTIIAINTAVYLMWQYAINERTRGNPKWFNWMQDNFYSNWKSLEAGRWWTSLTCAFSHNTLIHFALNMFVLHSFGNVAMQILGPSRFVVFYLAAAAFSSTIHLLYTRFIEPKVKPLPKGYIYGPSGFLDNSSHGASGAVEASLLLYALSYPFNPITLFFFIEVPAIVGIGGFIAYDLYLASSGQQGVVDSASHVGGAAFGMMYWAAFVRGVATRGRW
ncbi:hypothetical protein HDU98_003414 [Podochytrium sp. JEL0797]|nr:hypothetical protein HDU98_003414 [Podochytrium sp. JEL0797]